MKSCQNPELELFDKWTLSIGNGEITEENDVIREIPPNMCMFIEANTSENFDIEKISMQRLSDHVYLDKN